MNSNATTIFAPVTMAGTNSNGASRNRGRVVHALDATAASQIRRGGTWNRAACGAQPGRRGNGWNETEPGTGVTCPRCQRASGARP